MLRDRGYRADVVEKWIPGANIRKDLFGVIDILAIKDDETLGVQCTSYSNTSSRVQKIADCDATPDMRQAGWSIYVHGWHKVKNRWICREVDCS